MTPKRNGPAIALHAVMVELDVFHGKDHYQPTET